MTFDFTRITTLDDMNKELSLIGLAYTREFVDAVLSEDFPDRDLTRVARVTEYTFEPRVLTFRPGIDEKESTDIEAVYVTVGSIVRQGDYNYEDYLDLSEAGDRYREIIAHELRPAVAAWREAHPDEILEVLD